MPPALPGTLHATLGARAVLAAVGTPTGPAFDIVLLFHVTCVVIGLGAVVVSVVQAARVLGLQRAPSTARPALAGTLEPEVPPGSPRGAAPVSPPDASRLPPAAAQSPANLAGYYAPGTNWLARILYGVPVFGVLLVAMSRGAYDLSDAWIDIGIALWLVLITVGETVVWPAERRLGRDLLGSLTRSAGAPTESHARSLRRSAWMVCAGGTAMAVLMVVVVVVMVAQP